VSSPDSAPPPTGDRAALLVAVFDGLAEGLAVFDEGGLLDANRALCEMTGFERDELVGARSPFPFFPTEDEERHTSFLRELTEAGVAEAGLTLNRKNGSRFSASVTGGTVRRDDEVIGRVLTLRDVSALRRREERLAELASTDELTGLLNKRSFLVHLAGEVARTRRHERTVCLAILDLDGFKRINDAAGHPAGDRVLAEAANRLGALVRTGEHLARVGGDEFGWILPDADTQGAVAAVSRAREAISNEGFRAMGSLTLSAGICITDGSIDAPELYRRADRALYLAKTAGGNDAVVY